MLPFIPQSTSTSLDIGCAEGYFAEFVKIYPQYEAWGVQPLASAAQRLQEG